MSLFTVNLSKNSWHYKLQSFIWEDKRPNFNSLCPYFWFTIVTLLVSPFVLAFYLFMGAIYFGFVVPFVWIGENVFQKPLNKLLVHRTRHWLRNRDIMDVLVQIGYFNKRRKMNNGQPTFLGFKLNLDEMVELLDEVFGREKVSHYIHVNSHKVAVKKALAEDTYAVEEWNPLWWRSVVKYTEKGFKIVLTGLIIAFFLALISFVGWMAWNIPAKGYFQIGCFIAICLGILGLGYLLVKGVWPALKWVGRKVGNYAGDSLLINFIASSFKSACPAINWEPRPEDIDPYHGEM